MITRKEEHILLSVLLLEDKAYLVNVRQKLKEMTGRYLDVGSINKSLKKLEHEGYLNPEFGDPQPVRGGRAIKYYTLTEVACRALTEIQALHMRFWENVVIPTKKL